MIGPSGSGVEALARATCSLARRRGRFVPAGDSRGKVTQAELTLPAIHWQMTDTGTGAERVAVRHVDRGAAAQ